jgi:hypothetical protein
MPTRPTPNFVSRFYTVSLNLIYRGNVTTAPNGDTADACKPIPAVRTRCTNRNKNVVYGSLYPAIKTYGGAELKLHVFLTSILDGGE